LLFQFKEKKNESFILPQYITNTNSNIIPLKRLFINKMLESVKYKDMSGFRIQAKGRLTRRYTASRSITKIRCSGNLLNIDSSYNKLSTILLKGNLKSNIQFTKLKSKSRIGSFGIKGWVSGN
jgi:hypothetical protein